MTALRARRDDDHVRLGRVHSGAHRRRGGVRPPLPPANSCHLGVISTMFFWIKRSAFMNDWLISTFSFEQKDLAIDRKTKGIIQTKKKEPCSHGIIMTRGSAKTRKNRRDDRKRSPLWRSSEMSPAFWGVGERARFLVYCQSLTWSPFWRSSEMSPKSF